MNIIDVTSIDLHDAIIESIDINILDQSTKIRLKYYESTDAKERSSGVIAFRLVSAISGLLEFNALLDNSRSGNINHWTPSPASGTTYIYFLEGCLSVSANSIEFVQA